MTDIARPVVLPLSPGEAAFTEPLELLYLSAPVALNAVNVTKRYPGAIGL